MIKSIIQIKPYTCGAVSILNALKYLKIRHKENEETLEAKTNAQPEIGCENEDILRVIGKMSRKISHCSKINSTTEDMDISLNEGKVCLVNYFNAFSNVGHYSVIVGHDEHSYFLRDSVLGDLRLKKSSFAKHWHNGSKTIFGFYISIERK